MGWREKWLKCTGDLGASNLILGCSGTVLSGLMQWTQQVEISLWLCLWTFSLTTLLYQFHGFCRQLRQGEGLRGKVLRFFGKKRNLVLMLVLTVSFLFGPSLLVFATLPMFGSIWLYGGGGSGVGLRYLGLFKALMGASALSCLFGVFPLGLLGGIVGVLESWVALLLLFMHLWLNLNMGDMRDVFEDAVGGLKTFPGLFGFDRFRFVACFVAFFVGAFCWRIEPVLSIWLFGDGVALLWLRRETGFLGYCFVDVVHLLPVGRLMIA